MAWGMRLGKSCHKRVGYGGWMYSLQALLAGGRLESGVRWVTEKGILMDAGEDS